MTPHDKHDKEAVEENPVCGFQLLKIREAEMRQQAAAINAGRKPKFGDRMRNPWAGEKNPHRDGIFIRAKRVTGRMNPGLWYEMTDGKGEFWTSNGDTMMFIDHLSAPAPVAEQPKPPQLNSLGLAENWSVTVEVDAERVLCISNQHYAGVSGLETYEATIENCAKHLLAFIGADPVAAPAQPMTDQEIDDIANSIMTDDPVTWWRRFARAIEARKEQG